MDADPPAQGVKIARRITGFGGFAFLALALALLGFCNLSLVIFQRTTDTFVEVNPRRRFVGKETLRIRI